MADKITLEIDQPVELAFKYAEGKLCEKRWPNADDCYARATASGHVIFVDAEQEMRLRASVRAGQPVRLTKRKTKSGATWLQIDSVPAELKQPLGVHKGGRIPPEKYAQPAEPAPAKPPAIATQPDIPVESPNVMAECLKQAIVAAKHAQEFATSAAFPIVFGPDQIQALASTLFIQAAKTANINLMHRNEQLRNGRMA